jgi:hypothetical protein
MLLDIGIGKYEVKTLGNLFDKCRQIMAYPDDVIVMGGRLQDV